MISLLYITYIALLAIIVRTGFAYFAIYFKKEKAPLFNTIFLITAGVAYLLSQVIIRFAILPLVPALSDMEGVIAAFTIPLFLNDVLNRIVYVSSDGNGDG